MCSAWSAALAQQPRSPQMSAPPPMKFVSREERSQLDEAKDSKSRISITLELAADHLTKAEEFTAQKKFEQSCEELGRYLGLLADARTFLATMNPSKNSTRDLYKHFDIALRRLPPRLAVMRRPRMIPPHLGQNATPVNMSVSFRRVAPGLVTSAMRAVSCACSAAVNIAGTRMMVCPR